MRIRSAVPKRTKAVTGLVVAFMMIATAAAADAPIVTITGPSAGQVIQIETTEFPYMLPVTGTISHTSSSAMISLTASVNDGDEIAVWSGQQPDDVVWTFEYEVTAPGIYVIVASAAHGSAVGTDATSVTITTMTVSVDYPAAPSVASSLLEAAGVKSRYGNSRNGGSCIADVARHMGDGTDFAGVSKDHPDYQAAVEAFLDNFSHNGTHPCSLQAAG
jgi:hypothetical protein